MLRRSLLIAVATSFVAFAPAHAKMESTIDEWVNRFLPEQGPEIKLPSYAGPIDKARAEVTAGKFRAALVTLAGMAGAEDVDRKSLRAQCLLGLGEYDSADAMFNAEPLATDNQSTNVYVRSLLNRHKTSAAMPIIASWLERSPDSIQAHLCDGLAKEQLGEYDAAAASYHWFLDGQQAYVQKWLTDPMQFESADDLCDIATGVHRWATLAMAYKDQPSLNDTVLNMYLRAFDVIDRENISARIGAAEFAASRGDQRGAQKYLKPALERAPRNPDVIRAAIEFGAQVGDEESAAGPIDALRQNDPDAIEADLYETIALAHLHQWLQAAQRAERVYAKAPNDPEVIATYAATQYVLNGADACAKILSSSDDKSAETVSFAAKLLKDADQYAAAEVYFKATLERAPWDVATRHQLGGMLLNIGREDEARKVLDEAYKNDSYNLITVNYLRLLDDLAKYEKQQYEHVTIYFDRDADPIVGDVVGGFMEKTFEDLAKEFQYAPDGKAIIQVYPEDDDFSVRMAGVPGVENYGVSFGRVLATISPRRGTNKGNFNWGRVLRHELVHTFNLLQTQHRVPRWLTEGLAVWQEKVQFRFVDVPPELYKRTMEGSLFTIRGFANAFIHPTRAGDGEQAYTQGAWISRYLDETYGRESIVRLLSAYGAAKTDEQAFKEATGKSVPEIETEWHAWMKQQIGPWNLDEATTEKCKALMTEGDLAIKAKLFEQAIVSYEQVFQLQPTDMKAHQRLAYLYIQKETSNPAKAIDHLKFLHVFELQNNRFAKQIARLYLKLEDQKSALDWAWEAVHVDLYDSASYEIVAEIADKMNDSQTATNARATAAQIKIWEINRKKPENTETPAADPKP